MTRARVAGGSTFSTLLNAFPSALSLPFPSVRAPVISLQRSINLLYMLASFLRLVQIQRRPLTREIFMSTTASFTLHDIVRIIAKYKVPFPLGIVALSNLVGRRRARCNLLEVEQARERRETLRNAHACHFALHGRNERGGIVRFAIFPPLSAIFSLCPSKLPGCPPLRVWNRSRRELR